MAPIESSVASTGRERLWVRAVAVSAAACLALSLLATPVLGGQEPAPGIRWGRLAALTGAGVTAHYVSFEYFERTWYQGQKRDSIRWLHDWSGDTYLNLDKGGHFMGGLVLSTALADAYGWAGFRPRSSALLAVLTSWGVLLEIEMRDAYFDQWGFSIPDFTANTLGAAMPLVYALFPATRVVGFKMSYWPSSLYLDDESRAAAGRPHTGHFIDDYQGMTFWTTVAVGQLLGDRRPQVWPEWMGLALGYSATGMHGSNVKSRGRERGYPELPNARPEVFLGLDLDARYLPGENGWWQRLKRELNWVHFPTPAVRLHPGFRLYLIYM